MTEGGTTLVYAPAEKDLVERFLPWTREVRLSDAFYGTAFNSSTADRRWAFCSTISMLASLIASNILSRWFTRNLSR